MARRPRLMWAQCLLVQRAAVPQSKMLAPLMKQSLTSLFPVGIRVKQGNKGFKVFRERKAMMELLQQLRLVLHQRALRGPTRPSLTLEQRTLRSLISRFPVGGRVSQDMMGRSEEET